MRIDILPCVLCCGPPPRARPRSASRVHSSIAPAPSNQSSLNATAWAAPRLPCPCRGASCDTSPFRHHRHNKIPLLKIMRGASSFFFCGLFSPLQNPNTRRRACRKVSAPVNRNQCSRANVCADHVAPAILLDPRPSSAPPRHGAANLDPLRSKILRLFRNRLDHSPPPPRRSSAAMFSATSEPNLRFPASFPDDVHSKLPCRSSCSILLELVNFRAFAPITTPGRAVRIVTRQRLAAARSKSSARQPI